MSTRPEQRVQAGLLTPLRELDVVTIALHRVPPEVLLPEVHVLVHQRLQRLPERSVQVARVEGDLVEQALRVAPEGIGSQNAMIYALKAEHSIGHLADVGTVCPPRWRRGHLVPLPVLRALIQAAGAPQSRRADR